MPFYSSSTAFCLLRWHNVLLFRLVASDCLACLAAFGHSLSSLLLSLSLSPCRSHPAFIFCLAILLAISLSFLCHEATSVGYSEARFRLSHQGTQTNLCSVCRGSKARTSFYNGGKVGQTSGKVLNNISKLRPRFYRE